MVHQRTLRHIKAHKDQTFLGCYILHSTCKIPAHMSSVCLHSQKICWLLCFQSSSVIYSGLFLRIDLSLIFAHKNAITITNKVIEVHYYSYLVGSLVYYIKTWRHISFGAFFFLNKLWDCVCIYTARCFVVIVWQTFQYNLV